MTTADPTHWLWNEACAMIERAEQLHRSFFLPGRAQKTTAYWEPPIDVSEDQNKLTVLAALPGVKPDDVEISLVGATLYIAGVRRLSDVANDTRVHRLEIPHGRFERHIRIPGARWTISQSTLADGCLMISLTKSM